MFFGGFNVFLLRLGLVVVTNYPDMNMFYYIFILIHFRLIVVKYYPEMSMF